METDKRDTEELIVGAPPAAPDTFYAHHPTHPVEHSIPETGVGANPCFARPQNTLSIAGEAWLPPKPQWWSKLCGNATPGSQEEWCCILLLGAGLGSYKELKDNAICCYETCIQNESGNFDRSNGYPVGLAHMHQCLVKGEWGFA